MRGEPGPPTGPHFCSETERQAEVAAAEREQGLFRGSGGGTSEGGTAQCRRLCPPVSCHPRVPERDGASRSARLARAVRRHGGGGDGGTRAPRFCSAGSGRSEAAERRVVLVAVTMSADEEELKVPEEMFKDVKFFTVGDIDPKVPPRPPLGLLPAARVPTPLAGDGGRAGRDRPPPRKRCPASLAARRAGGGTRPRPLRGRAGSAAVTAAPSPPARHGSRAAAARRPRAALRAEEGREKGLPVRDGAGG